MLRLLDEVRMGFVEKYLFLCKKTNNDYCHGLMYRLFLCTDICVQLCWDVLAALAVIEKN